MALGWLWDNSEPGKGGDGMGRHGSVLVLQGGADQEGEGDWGWGAKEDVSMTSLLHLVVNPATHPSLK